MLARIPSLRSWPNRRSLCGLGDHRRVGAIGTFGRHRQSLSGRVLAGLRAHIRRLGAFASRDAKQSACRCERYEKHRIAGRVPARMRIIAICTESRPALPARVRLAGRTPLTVQCRTRSSSADSSCQPGSRERKRPCRSIDRGPTARSGCRPRRGGHSGR